MLHRLRVARFAGWAFGKRRHPAEKLEKLALAAEIRTCSLAVR